MIKSKQIVDLPYATLNSSTFGNSDGGWSAELNGSIGTAVLDSRRLAVEQTSGFVPGPGYVLGNIDADLVEMFPFSERPNIVFEASIELDRTHMSVLGSSTRVLLIFGNTNGAGVINFLSQPVYVMLNAIQDGAGDSDVSLLYTDGFATPDATLPLGKLSLFSVVAKLRAQITRGPTGTFDYLLFLDDKLVVQKTGFLDTDFGFDAGLRPALSIISSQAGFVNYFHSIRFWQLPPGGAGGGGGGGVTLPVGWAAAVIDDTGVSGTVILRVTTAGLVEFDVDLTDLAYDTAQGYDIGFEISEGW